LLKILFSKVKQFSTFVQKAEHMAKTAKRNIEDVKYLAKILYTREQLEGKVIAQRVGVAEKTMSKWVTEGNWKALRNRLLISKDNQINLLYEQLENLNTIIQQSKAGHADSKQADILIKYTAAIRNLETDLAIADLVEAGIRFIKYIQKTGSMEQVMEVAEIWNSFLQASIRK
jgi:transposase